MTTQPQTAAAPLIDRAHLPVDGQIVGGRYGVVGKPTALGEGWTCNATDESGGGSVVLEVVASGAVQSEERAAVASVMTRLIGVGEPACCHYSRIHENDGQLILVRPGPSGIALDVRLKQGPLETPAAVAMGQSVLRALGAAHKRGVVHLDVRPHNIELQPDGSTVLTGFGRPAAFNPHDSLPDDPTATVRYVAPEQAGVLGDGSGPVDLSDLYSAGAVLFEALAGRPLLAAGTLGSVLRGLATAPAPELRSLGVDVPRALDEVLQRLLRKDPQERYQSAPAAVYDLDAIRKAIETGQPEPRLVIGLRDRRRTLTEPAFVGRDAEMATLVDLVGHTGDGDGGVVLLEADSGGGKSRLLTELQVRCTAQGATVLYGQGLAQSAQQPFQVLAGIAEGLNARAQADPVERARLQEALGDHWQAACAALPILAEGLDVETGAEIGPETFGAVRSVAALTALVRSLGSGEQAALVILDDCQWADELTLDVLHRLQVDGEVSGVLVVAAFRSEEVGSGHRLRAIPRATKMALPNFEPDDLRLLVESMAGPVPEPALQLIARLSGGSPFMATAALRGLVETSTLVSGPKGWTLDEEALARAQFSDRAGAVLARRIDRLVPTAVEFLTTAAVVGKEFNLELVATLCAQTHDVAADSLAHARRRHFVWISTDEKRCAFVHDKLREALLARLTEPARRAIHLSIAERLEVDSDSHPFQLAFHFHEAGEPARALPYALAAAKQARSQHALELAEAQYVIAQDGCDTSDREVRFQIAKGLSEVRTLRGHYEPARIATLDARGLAVRTRDRAEMEGRLGDLAFRQGDLAGGIAGFRRALELLGHRVPQGKVGALLGAGIEGVRQILHTAVPTFLKLGRKSTKGAEEALLAVHIFGRLTYAFYFGSGQALTLWSHLRGMNIAERYTPTAELADAYAIHGPVMAMVGFFARALTYVRKSRAIAEELGDLWGQGHALAFESVVLYGAARYEQCMRTSQRAVALLRRSGDYWDVNAARVQTAFCLFRLGRLDECAELAREVHESGLELGDTTASGFSLDVWARATGGQVPDHVLDGELSQRRDDAQVTAQVLYADAERHTRHHRYPQAVASLERGLQLVSDAGVRNPYTLPLRSGLAVALRRQAQTISDLAPSERLRLLRAARAHIRKAVWMARLFRNDLPFALREAGIIDALLGNETAARKRFDEGIEVAASMGAEFEKARTHQVRGEMGVELGWPGAAQEEAAGRAAILALGGAFVLPNTEIAAPLPAPATLSLADRFASVLEAGRRIASALERADIHRAMCRAADELLRGQESLIVTAAGADVEGEILSGAATSAPCWTTVRRAVAGERCVLYTAGDRTLETEALLIGGVRSALCVPIVVRGNVPACLYVTHRGVSGLFGDEEGRLADFIATLGGAAWENADGFEELQRLTASLEHRVAERTSALEASNLQLQQFAYIASHDLQAPLRSVAGFAQLLELDHADSLNDEAKSHLAEIVTGAKRMQSLIEDLLEYARVDAGGRMFEPVDLDKACRHALGLLKAEIQDAGAHIDCDALGTVNGDFAQLRQLLQNLVGNALKYRSESAPQIRVWVERTDTHWSLSVQDNGIGIAERYHTRIFDIFKRLHTQRAYPGTGIGLAVCRRIVERHGGKLTVQSVPEHGSTFCATVPL